MKQDAKNTWKNSYSENRYKNKRTYSDCFTHEETRKWPTYLQLQCKGEEIQLYTMCICICSFVLVNCWFLICIVQARFRLKKLHVLHANLWPYTISSAARV